MVTDRNLTELQETGETHIHGEVTISDLAKFVNSLGVKPNELFISVGHETLRIHAPKMR